MSKCGLKNHRKEDSVRFSFVWLSGKIYNWKRGTQSHKSFVRGQNLRLKYTRTVWNCRLHKVHWNYAMQTVLFLLRFIQIYWTTSTLPRTSWPSTYKMFSECVVTNVSKHLLCHVKNFKYNKENQLFNTWFSNSLYYIWFTRTRSEFINHLIDLINWTCKQLFLQLLIKW